MAKKNKNATTAILSLLLVLQSKTCMHDPATSSHPKTMEHATKQKVSSGTNIQPSQSYLEAPKETTPTVDPQDFTDLLSNAIENDDYAEIDDILQNAQDADTNQPSSNNPSRPKKVHKWIKAIRALLRKTTNPQIAKKLKAHLAKIEQKYLSPPAASLHKIAYRHKKKKLEQQLANLPKMVVASKLLKKDESGYSVFASSYLNNYTSRKSCTDMFDFILQSSKYYLGSSDFELILKEIEDIERKDIIPTSDAYQLCKVLESHAGQMECTEKIKETRNAYCNAPCYKIKAFPSLSKEDFEKEYASGLTEQLKKLQKDYSIQEHIAMQYASTIINKKYTHKKDFSKQDQQRSIIDELMKLLIILPTAKEIIEKELQLNKNRDQVVDHAIDNIIEKLLHTTLIRYNKNQLRIIIKELYNVLKEYEYEYEAWNNHDYNAPGGEYEEYEEWDNNDYNTPWEYKKHPV